MTLSIAKVSKPSCIAAFAPNHHGRFIISPEEAAENSPFLLLLENWLRPSSSFHGSPRRGMETVTFVLSGQLLHEDESGAIGGLGAGAVAFMTAGGGVLNNEMPGSQGVHSLQLWLNLPARLKWTSPRYTDMDSLAARVYAEPGVLARVYAGRLGEIYVEHGSTWPLTLIELNLEAGSRFEVPALAGQRLFAYVLAGEAALGAEGRSVTAGEVAWPFIPQATHRSTLMVFARSTVRLLVYASPIIDEPINLAGTFAMSTDLEVKQAYDDLCAGELACDSQTT